MGFLRRRTTEQRAHTALRAKEEQHPALSSESGNHRARNIGIAAAVILILGGRLFTGCQTRNEIIQSAGIEFVTIPAGSFMMGCSPGDNQCQDDERPAHQVEITKSFEMGKYEVTQGQWAKMMGSNPSKFKVDDRLPVESVSWDDAQAFIAKLNAMKDGYRYCLPTEAEWEYAARGGVPGPHYADLNAIGWYGDNSGKESYPPGQKQPNRFGLYDMIGNVWEWCDDWYEPEYYKSSPHKDPQGPSTTGYRVLRGGSRLSIAMRTRMSFRYAFAPDIRSAVAGLRLCRQRY